MDDAMLTLAILAAAGLLAYTLTQDQSTATDNSAAMDATTEQDVTAQPAATDDWTSLDGIMAAARNLVGAWTPPAKYATAIRDAEQKNGLPTDMLARLLWQESRYREDIITGAVRSPAGALGIAQFMPATARDMGINPLDPFQAIPAAGRYLASLYRQTGTWEKALAAYNWGIGNVLRRGMAAAPPETRNYFSQILADVNSANGTTWA